MAFYGVGLEVAVNKVNLNFKMHIKQKGGIGIRSLSRIFKRFDFNGNNKLDSREFEDALGAFGLFPSKIELQALMKFYDVDGDGNVSYDEFLRGLRDSLNDRRLGMVKKCFEIMDKDKSGQVTVSDIIHIYCVNNHRDFLEGRKSKKEIVAEFLNEFDGAKGNNDGIVTWKEWVDYYSDISMGIANDEYFIQMMESVWQIPEKEDTASYKSKIDQLTGYTKQQLSYLLSASKNKEEAAGKVFEDYDLNMDGYITIDELTAMIAKLGISMERKMATGVFRNINSSNSGAISPDEFKYFILS